MGMVSVLLGAIVGMHGSPPPSPASSVAGEVLHSVPRKAKEPAPVPGQTQGPGPAPRPSAGPPRPAPGPAGKTVLLRYGDTLYDLAGHHGTTVKALQRLNGLGSSTLIYAGDTLRVPTTRDAATDTPAAARFTTSAGAGHPGHEDRSRESGVTDSRW
ncbi:LysM peptidoglycan-binding domain-containing protein [Streptomyces sp. NPDC056708]|uniref:LysM peptidoglycan-binding domain-containing protein n=2 Tax=Streptomyces TaxID=1883 RepID=UPI0036C2B3B1